MKEQSDIMPKESSLPAEQEQLVSIYVKKSHPMLKLKEALPWEEIKAVMVKHWRAAGKNVDGGRGQKLDVELFVAVIVLMLLKGFHARQMEEYLAESVVARIFIARP